LGILLRKILAIQKKLQALTAQLNRDWWLPMYWEFQYGVKSQNEMLSRNWRKRWGCTKRWWNFGLSSRRENGATSSDWAVSELSRSRQSFC
jgi:hypothetical protein